MMMRWNDYKSDIEILLIITKSRVMSSEQDTTIPL